jgi:hypothetical protein
MPRFEYGPIDIARWHPRDPRPGAAIGRIERNANPAPFAAPIHRRATGSMATGCPNLP